jgi:cell division protein FtsB
MAALIDVLGMAHGLAPGGTTVGRETDNDLAFDDSSMSLHHAKLWAGEDGVWCVEDLGSTNLTLLNGAELDANDAFELRKGDRLSFGSVVLVFDPEQAGQSFEGRRGGDAFDEASQLLDAADKEIVRLSAEVAALKAHVGQQDLAIKSRDEALKLWEQRMQEVNASWMSREELVVERQKIETTVRADTQRQIDAAVRRYNEMEARYVQVAAKVETLERQLKESNDQVSILTIRLKQ